MPKSLTDFLVFYPYRVAFVRTVYPPKEFAPGVPREYPDRPLDDDGNEITPDYPAGLPRGEVHKVNAISQIYYDAAGNPEKPEWVELPRDQKVRQALEPDLPTVAEETQT